MISKASPASTPLMVARWVKPSPVAERRRSPRRGSPGSMVTKNRRRAGFVISTIVLAEGRLFTFSSHFWVGHEVLES